MSEQNVQTVRDIYESLGRMNDFADVRPVVERYAHPDVEWAPIEAPETYQGHDGVERAFAAWFEAMEDFDVDLKELIDAGERVIAVTYHSARGKGSGMEVGQWVFQLFSFREGKISRFEEFAERDEAMRAAGLG